MDGRDNKEHIMYNMIDEGTGGIITMEQTMMEMMMAPNTSTWMKPTEEMTMTNSLVETTVELTVATPP